jgi:hypothetical protein
MSCWFGLWWPMGSVQAAATWRSGRPGCSRDGGDLRPSGGGLGVEGFRLATGIHRGGSRDVCGRQLGTTYGGCLGASNARASGNLLRPSWVWRGV